jgi:DNA-binding NarL/FixJ family response regulator
MSQDLPDQAKLRILVVDDHEIVLNGTVNPLKAQYPDAEILTAQTEEIALLLVKRVQPDLVMLDLSIPETVGGQPRKDIGIQLLRTLLQSYPELNLTVQTSYVEALTQVRHEIEGHRGGFTVVGKDFSSAEMLRRVDWALNGVTHTKDMRWGLEFKPEWMTVLQLAFKEGLQDRAIAQRMNVSDRTVRHYWTKIYDALDLYPEDCRKDGKSIRTQAGIRAREEFLID